MYLGPLWRREKQRTPGLVLYAHWHTHVHLPGYYCLMVSRETADLSLRVSRIDSWAENRCEGAAERWRDGGESWYQSRADNFMSLLEHEQLCRISGTAVRPEFTPTVSMQYMVDSWVRMITTYTCCLESKAFLFFHYILRNHIPESFSCYAFPLQLLRNIVTLGRCFLYYENFKKVRQGWVLIHYCRLSTFSGIMAWWYDHIRVSFKFMLSKWMIPSKL